MAKFIKMFRCGKEEDRGEIEKELRKKWVLAEMESRFRWDQNLDRRAVQQGLLKAVGKLQAPSDSGEVKVKLKTYRQMFMSGTSGFHSTATAGKSSECAINLLESALHKRKGTLDSEFTQNHDSQSKETESCPLISRKR